MANTNHTNTSVTDRIMVISDLHCPYSHPDTLAFLKAVKAKFKPTTVVLTGDEIDWHSVSFHDQDPDLKAPGDELIAAIEQLKPIYKLFPKAYVLESNHGSLIYRKAFCKGLPKAVLKNYNEILEAPKDWIWVNDLTLNTILGPIYFHHSRGKALRTSQLYGMSHICGHMHNSFDITYWSTPMSLNFAMTVGCLIDKSSLAFAYNKINLQRPIIGLGVVIDGVPQLVPMLLNKKGRWIKKL